MTRTIANIVGELAEAYRHDRDAIKMDILVMGPALGKNGDDNAARQLRAFLVERCQSYGVTVLAEHRGLISLAKSHYGEGYDLCKYETYLAGKMQAIILIPSSPGSFAELGLFSLEKEDICRKMMVLFERRFWREKSFLMEGPKRALRISGAELRFVEYENVERIWNLVEGHLQTRRAILLNEKRRASGLRAER